jgi:hypothetical protein
MAERISVPRGRYRAIVHAASLAACSCANQDTRGHDGLCVSCWALRERLEHARRLAASPTVFSSQEVTAIVNDSAKREVERCEAEQRLRAEQLPIAIRLLAEARKGDEW